MHYTNRADAQLMRRRAMDPSVIMRRQGLMGLTDITQIGRSSTLQSTASGISAGMAVGSAIGSVVPIAGTAIGALVGGAVGAIAAAFNRQDQEVQNFNQAMQMAQQGGPAAVLNIGNKYLVLAGLFDLEASQIKGNIPFYKKYGRMGEQRFVMDMCGVIQAAANAGVINNNDTPQSVYTKVVLPWINGMGYGTFSDSNAAMLGYIMMGMIAEYCAGIFSQRWYARGGDMPFGSLHPFTLPQAAQPAQPQITASPTPSPQASAPAAQPVDPLTLELQLYQANHMPTKGQTIHFARTTSGEFLALPQAATFWGFDSQPGHQSAWLFNLNGQMYEVQGTSITPFDTGPSATLPAQSVVPQVNQQAPVTTVASATDAATGQPIPTQYIPSGGGGGGGGYSMPMSSAPVPAVASSSFSMEEIGLGVGLLALVLFMATKHGQ